MIEYLEAGLAVPETLLGIAYIIVARCNGKATIIRARRGNPEPDPNRSIVLRLTRSAGRKQVVYANSGKSLSLE